MNNAVRRDFQLNGKVYLSHDEQISDVVNATTSEIVRLELKNFNEN